MFSDLILSCTCTCSPCHVQSFDERAYQQPSLFDESCKLNAGIAPRSNCDMKEDEVDSDVDADGRLQLNEDGEVRYSEQLTAVL